MRTIRDWLFTIPFLVGFGLTLVAFDVVARAVRPFGLRRFELVMARLQRTLLALLRISGTRLQVERSQLIEPHTGYIIVSNHQGLFDIPIIGGLLPTNHPKFVAKKSLGRWLPAISLNLRKGGSALIDRDDRIGSIRAITTMARSAQERNVSVVIFPEGTRSRDGQVGEFQAAGTQVLLRKADRLKVIPVAIDGSTRLMASNLLPVPYGTTIRVRMGDPIDRSDKDAAALSARAEAWIRETMAEWDSEADSA
jgi:1-acyl-sn-glycerol-3-phosphate acyltransferase